MNKAVMDVHVRPFQGFMVSFFLGKYLEEELRDRMLNVCLTL